MKKNSGKNMRNKTLLIKKNSQGLQMMVEDQPICLGDKVTCDNLLHLDNVESEVFNDVTKKSKPLSRSSGSHSLSELRSFRFR